MILENNTHLIFKSLTVRDALNKLEEVVEPKVLFVIDDKHRLVGSVSDGDLRRALINGLSIDSVLPDVMNSSPAYLLQGENFFQQLEEFRKRKITLIPILDQNKVVLDLVDFKKLKSLLPISALIMAGGLGSRLGDLTKDTPKPLLKVGEKPIIEHNKDRLIQFGVREIFISVKYLGEQIEKYFGDGSSKGITIKYIKEEEPRGTIGALSQVDEIANDHILVMNSDLLTNIDFEDFYKFHIQSNSEMSVASIPYEIKIPYAVLEMEQDFIKGFQEKPTYTYMSNAGIYLLNTSNIEFIPNAGRFDATDFIDFLIKNQKKISAFPLYCYWLDIGKPKDFEKAQFDIKNLHIF